MSKSALSEELSLRMATEEKSGAFVDFSCPEESAIRRLDDPSDTPSIWRPAFMRDRDKILYCPFYSRYSDKTQVFSLYRNDDVTRRWLHVQFVSNIACTIGRALHLNTDLIEAIALGHDIGHTPFGHTGEKELDRLYFARTGRHFSHNIHSVRVLDEIFPFNLTLQTLNGIAAHNGESLVHECAPVPVDGFTEFDRQIEACNLDKKTYIEPMTMEACVVRFSDVIAYLGKDRMDAARTAKMVDADDFLPGVIGHKTPEIINNLEVNIIENSYGKPFICVDEDHFEALNYAVHDNYHRIYENPLHKSLLASLGPMMEQIYDKMLADLDAGDETSPIFTHHIRYVEKMNYPRQKLYSKTDHNQLVVDYIASMTDDYFVDLYRHLFPESDLTINYIGYFD